MVVLSLPRLTMMKNGCVGLALRENAVLLNAMNAGHVVLAQILLVLMNGILDFCL